MKGFIWLCFLFGTVQAATLQDELNDWFGAFFSGNEVATETEPLDFSVLEAVNPLDYETVTSIPEISLPETPILDDLDIVNQQIRNYQKEVLNLKNRLVEGGLLKSQFSLNYDQELERLSLLERAQDETSSQTSTYQAMMQNWQRTWADLTNGVRQQRYEKAYYETEYKQALEDFYFYDQLYNQPHHWWMRWTLSDKPYSYFYYQDRQKEAELLVKKEAWQKNRQEFENLVERLDSTQKALKKVEKLYESSEKASQALKTVTERKVQGLRDVNEKNDQLQQDFETVQWQLDRYETWLARLQLAKRQLAALNLTSDTLLEVADDNSTAVLVTHPVDPPILISARFNDPWYEKTLGRKHEGVDYEVPVGTAVRSVAAGRVKAVYLKGKEYGYVTIDHGKGLLTVYGHISKALVKNGGLVKKSQIIAESGGSVGAVGSGSWSSGPHLHFAVIYKGEYIDPNGSTNVEGINK